MNQTADVCVQLVTFSKEGFAHHVKGRVLHQTAKCAERRHVLRRPLDVLIAIQPLFGERRHRVGLCPARRPVPSSTPRGASELSYVAGGV